MLMAFIHRLLGVLLVIVGAAFLVPVIFGSAVLTGIGACLVPIAILAGLVLIII
jgi:hypothetical protein